MGRSSKDTMESPYSARLPSSLSWRQNREDTSSSRNGRWAAPVFLAVGEPLRFDPSADAVFLAVGEPLRFDPSADARRHRVCA